MKKFTDYFTKEGKIMSKSIHCLLLLLALLVPTGCATVTGAANGMSQDIQNASDPTQNGWDTLEDIDSWMRQNLW